MRPLTYILTIALGAVFTLFLLPSECFGQSQSQRWNPQANWDPNRPTQLRLAYVPRNQSRPGDFKVVVVPATNARQARLDAQTYHLGWDAVDARMGQSRVMFEVLLQRRPDRVPGTPPVTRPIPR